jgi:hypothetical protein
MTCRRFFFARLSAAYNASLAGNGTLDNGWIAEINNAFRNANNAFQFLKGGHGDIPLAFENGKSKSKIKRCSIF